MVVLNRIAVLSKTLSMTTSKICTCQKELVADLLNIFPIEPVSLVIFSTISIIELISIYLYKFILLIQTHTDTFSFKILGVPLPNSVFTGIYFYFEDFF